MLSIRMIRAGKRHAPAFRIVVQEKHRAPVSKYIEKLGHYIPHQKPKIVEINAERVNYWISQGAQPTDSVHNLLVSHGIVADKKRAVTSITKKRSAKLGEKKAAAKAQEEERLAKAAEAKAAAEAASAAKTETVDAAASEAPSDTSDAEASSTSAE